MTEGRLRSLRVFCYAQILSSLTINADIMNKKLMALTDKSMRRLMCVYVCVCVVCSPAHRSWEVRENNRMVFGL